MTLNNLEDLYVGHGYRRGANMYPDTKSLVEPFIEAVDDYVTGYAITAQMPNDVAVDVLEMDDRENVEEYKVYSRVLVEGILKPEYQLSIGHDDHYTKTIGFLYALDTQNPVVKCYSGWLRQACTNLCVFNPNGIVTKQFASSDFKGIYESPLRFVQDAELEVTRFRECTEELMTRTYEKESLNQLLGYLAIHCIAKNTGLGTAYSNLIKMLQSNREPSAGIKNIYYKPDGVYTKYDLYQALTGTLSQKADTIVRPDISYKAFKIFGAN